MFNFSSFELLALGIWVIGLVVAVLLLWTRDFSLRGRFTILIAALVLPVLGSLLVIGYGVYLGVVGLRERRKIPPSQP